MPGCCATCSSNPETLLVDREFAPATGSLPLKMLFLHDAASMLILILLSFFPLSSALPVDNEVKPNTSSIAPPQTTPLTRTSSLSMSTSQYIIDITLSTSNEETVRPCQVSTGTYQHREQIPRNDPCDLCVCVDAEMYCLWRLCPPTTPPAATTTAAATFGHNNTQVEREFSQLITQQREFNAIREKTKSQLTTPSTSTADPTTCFVMGVRYKLGEVLPRDTGTCLECVCVEGARVTCSPKDCASQPDLDYLQHSNSLDMFDLDTF